MKFFIGLFILTQLAALRVPLQRDIKITFRVEPQSIEAGQPALLTWSVENARSVLISEIGKVDASGQSQVNPTSITKYTLIAENQDVVSSKTIELLVTGGRGGDEFPQDYSLFRYPVSYRRSRTSLVAFLDQIRGALQNDMTFTVRGPQSEGARYLFVTNKSERGYLMQSDDRQNRIGRRRISYIVEVESPDSRAREVTYTIKAFIEYKRVIESTWRIESREGIYRTELDRLQAKISSLK